jgi:hypothetical protein
MKTRIVSSIPNGRPLSDPNTFPCNKFAHFANRAMSASTLFGNLKCLASHRFKQLIQPFPATSPL